MEERLPKGTLGGQAVIEGVMMKGKDSYSVAIRKPDQKIEVKLQKYSSFGDRHAWARIPFLRGVVNFAESMVVGMKTLSYSSSFYEEEEEETKADKLIKEVFKEKAEGVIMGLTLFLSVILAIALFMMLPAAIGEFIGKWVDNRLLLSLIEGIIRLAIFIIYVVLISQMEDIRRVFMYHGAEHKTINCYEAGEELTPENVAKHSRYHKRCGTSFLFIVMVVSIVIFMFITADQMWLRFLLRLLLIPVVAGISYEFIKLAGRSDNAVMNILSKPGMWIQRLTTKEPEEEMIQVAIISVESVLYGKPYVNAVNEAQGLGKAAKRGEVVTEEVQEEIEEAIDMLEDDGGLVGVTGVMAVDDATTGAEPMEEVVGVTETVVSEEEIIEVVEEIVEVVEESAPTEETVDETVVVEDMESVVSGAENKAEVIENAVDVKEEAVTADSVAEEKVENTTTEDVHTTEKTVSEEVTEVAEEVSTPEEDVIEIVDEF